MKILTKLAALLICITLCYILLMQINWSCLFQIQENQAKLGDKIGELIISDFQQNDQLLQSDSADIILDSLFYPLLIQNNINSVNYKLHIINSTEINAFAIPGNQIIVTTGLVNFLDSAQYLSAILAHEIAHCEKNHVMKSLINQFGLDLLLSGSGAPQITNFLTRQAFSRKLEIQADKQAIIYLNGARVNPNNLSRVMLLFDAHFADEKTPSWVSSHPDSFDRSKMIDVEIKNITHKNIYKPQISPTTWTTLQKLMTDDIQNLN